MEEPKEKITTDSEVQEALKRFRQLAEMMRIGHAEPKPLSIGEEVKKTLVEVGEYKSYGLNELQESFRRRVQNPLMEKMNGTETKNSIADYRLISMIGILKSIMSLGVDSERLLSYMKNLEKAIMLDGIDYQESVLLSSGKMPALSFFKDICKETTN